MQGEEFVLAIVAITMGTGVLITAITKITDLIKTWIGKNRGYDEETFERLARAFMEHKKESERRIQNLEAIISEKENEHDPTSGRLEKPSDTLEIEDNSEERQQMPSDSGSGSGKLNNMLRN